MLATSSSRWNGLVVRERTCEPRVPNAATAGWTFHDIVTRKHGIVRRSKGAVMQTWVKVAGDWKVAAAKPSEVPTNTQSESPPSN